MTCNKILKLMMWRVWNIKKQQWLLWDKYKVECIKQRTSKTNIILRDAKQYLNIKRDVNLYLVTQMWENGELNVQCVWCCNNYDDFTNKTVTFHNIKTRAYTGSRFWATHMNKKNWRWGYLKSGPTWNDVYQQLSQ